MKTSLSVFLSCCIAFTAFATPADFYQAYLPAGIQIGCSVHEVRNQRPGIIENPMHLSAGVEPENALELIEPPKHGQVPLGYWYRFKDGELRAVTRSLLVRGLPEAHLLSSASTLYGELKTNFVLKGTEKVLRSTGVGATLLTAELWEDATTGLEVYFVASSEETTLIVFDPKIFSRRSFFLGPERMKDFEAPEEAVEGVNDKATESPYLITDLLPKVAAANATAVPPAASNSEATRSPITPNAAAPTATPKPSPVVQAEPSKSPPWPWIVGAILLLAVAGGILLKLRGK